MSDKQIIVVRNVRGGFATDTVHTEDPQDALEAIREDERRAGSQDVLHAFTIESHGGTPVFTPVGVLDADVAEPD